LLKFQHPSTKNSDIPHRMTIANTVHDKANKVRDTLKGLFGIGWITSDNVTSNDKMMTQLKGELCLVEHTDEDSDTFYASGDTLGKLWAFINLVFQLSPQASMFFFKCCAEEGLPHLDLIKYVCTCWSSMYNLLEHASLLKLVSSRFN
ncbi:hypothetical protein EI94DRAFT_1612708, partial [Lactarius quietus]